MRKSKSFGKYILTSAIGMAFALAAQGAAASVVINTLNNTSSAGVVLTNALLAPNSGIHILGNSETYQGINNNTLSQSGRFSNFNLAPSSGSTPTLALENGILLTSGNANLPSSNTTATFSTSTGSGGNAMLSTLANKTTFDANTVGFSFTVDQSINAISAKFVFGTDEFNEYNITDIFGFFVDGVNYAKFANGDLISNSGAAHFISNTGGAYGIEYDGLSNVLTVTGLLNPNLTTHTFMVGIADTNDSIIDSGVFISSLRAGTADTGGIGDPTSVPEPASLSLIGLGLAAAFAQRRRAKSPR
jgi:hypothetical protein